MPLNRILAPLHPCSHFSENISTCLCFGFHTSLVRSYTPHFSEKGRWLTQKSKKKKQFHEQLENGNSNGFQIWNMKRHSRKIRPTPPRPHFSLHNWAKSHSFTQVTVVPARYKVTGTPDTSRFTHSQHSSIQREFYPVLLPRWQLVRNEAFRCKNARGDTRSAFINIAF